MSSQPKLNNVTAELQLARRLEAAEMLPCKEVVELVSQTNHELGCMMEPIAGGWAFFAGVGSPMTHAIGIGLHGAVSDEDFDRLESFYRDRNSPCEIVTSPMVDGSLLEHAGKRGYRLTEFNSVLALDLRSYTAVPPPSQIRIVPVGPPEIAAWSQVLVEGFAELGALPPELFRPFAEIRNSVCRLAFLDGVPVASAAGSVCAEQGIAALYGAATLPTFRRRGLQTALLHSRLRTAQEAGCDLAVVTTQPGSDSQRNSERLGFHVVYTKVVLVRDFTAK
ncbi:MAG TPA: GNAT family N-acetyltransferase [Clostridia bacterium]|nr:GNAT family N-acetyltransferase [Clostridia bacterium]